MCSQGTWVELQRGEKGKAINSGTGHLQGTVAAILPTLIYHREAVNVGCSWRHCIVLMAFTYNTS